MYEDLEQRAQAIDAQYRKQADEARQNVNFSDAGKADFLAKTEAARRQQIAALQDEARRRIDADRARVALDLKKAKGAEAKRLREVLGDQVALTLYRERIARMTSKEILAAYEDAADDWEKAVVGEFGRLVVEERAKSDAPTREDFTAVQGLKKATSPALVALEDKARDLERADKWVADLDFDAYRGRIADTFGFNPANVPAPFGGAGDN